MLDTVASICSESMLDMVAAIGMVKSVLVVGELGARVWLLVKVSYWLELVSVAFLENRDKIGSHRDGAQSVIPIAGRFELQLRAHQQLRAI